MSKDPEFAVVEESPSGPTLIVGGVRVRQELGTDFNDRFHALAKQVNAAWNASRTEARTYEQGIRDALAHILSLPYVDTVRSGLCVNRHDAESRLLALLPASEGSTK